MSLVSHPVSPPLLAIVAPLSRLGRKRTDATDTHARASDPRTRYTLDRPALNEIDRERERDSSAGFAIDLVVSSSRPTKKSRKREMKRRGKRVCRYREQFFFSTRGIFSPEQRSRNCANSREYFRKYAIRSPAMRRFLLRAKYPATVFRSRRLGHMFPGKRTRNIYLSIYLSFP